MRAIKICKKILLIILIVVVVVIIFAFLFLQFYPGVGKTPDKDMQAEYAKENKLFYDGEFHNENDFTLMTDEIKSSDAQTTPEGEIPVVKNFNIDNAKSGQLKFTWLGHSSSLIQMGTQNVLIDPVLTEYASPVSFVGVKRFSDIALKPQNVPEIDVLLISHDHYDHLDYQTIKSIDGKVENYICPFGVDSYLKGWGIDEDKIFALDWWESKEINGVEYTLVPSQHYTGRNPLKQNISLWGGYHFADESHSVYYTGDTGYYDVFSRVYEKFGEVDLMLADSGQYDKAWSSCHMNPEEAVQAAVDAHAKWYIPVHWGAFKLANHSWDEPIILGTQTAEKLGVNIATPIIGDTFDYDDIENNTQHWWESVQ